MKFPRDVSGVDLAQRLSRLGYQITRQSGSHVRLTRHTAEGEQHVTVPAHRTLKVGTLSSILAEVADQLNLTRDQLVTQLWP